MPKLPRRVFLVFALDFILFFFCLVGTYRATHRATVPVQFQSGNGFVLVRSASSQNDPLTLLPSDTVVAVNGLTVCFPKDVEFVLDGLRIGEQATFGLRSNGVTVSRVVELVPFYAKPYFFIQLAVGCLFFSLGIFVLAKRPEEESALAFHWASLSVALLIMTTSNRFPADFLGLSRVLDFLYSAAAAFAPALFAHFSLVFPRPKWPEIKRLFPMLYLVAGVLSLWTGLTFFMATSFNSLDWFQRFNAGYIASRAFFISCIAFSLGSLIHSYRTAAEEAERRKLRWVMLGLNLGPPIFIAWQLPILLETQRLVREEFMHIALSLVPITFAISIIRHRLMNIDLIFRRSTVYALVLGALLALYAIIIGTTAKLFETFAVVPALASGSAAILVALLFEPMRRVVQRFVDRAFFRVQYNVRQAEHRFADEIKRLLNVPELAEMIVLRTQEILPVERIGFLSLKQPGPRLHLLAHQNLERLQTHGIHLDVGRLKGLSALPLALEEHLEPGVPFMRVEPEVLLRWGIALVFPILSKDSGVLGFFAVGPKKSAVRFSMEDVELLTTVATQAGLAIERITLQAELLLKQAEARRLEELNRIKGHFVSSVSHDLKTPLTAIKLFAEMLRSRGNLPLDEKQEYLEIIEGECERLTRLINNVLDFARVEQGVKEYHFTEFEVNEGVRQVLRALRYQFKMENFNLVTNLCPEKLFVQADQDAFFEAVQNLLSNTLKYAQEKKEVSVSTFRSDARAVVQVEDCGIGISDEDLPRIFEPFYRGKNERAQGVGGTGLGLALVKHMVELHGGKIEVVSTPGQGSRFSLLFPLEETL